MKTWDDAIAQYDQTINDTYPEVQIMGLSWEPARVLREIDLTVYRCGLFDYIDSCDVDSDDLEGDYDL